MRSVTGLIYLVIIALWAAVLIPIWLRRHDQISEVRSTARFTSAMRSLGSPGQVQYADTHILERGEVSIGRAGDAPSRSEARMSRSGTDRTPSAGLDPTYERELVRQAAATRRAIVLATLTGLLLVALVLAIVSVVPKWVPAIAVLPVAGFIAATVLTASARSTADTRSTRPARRGQRSADAAQAAERPDRQAQSDEEWENWNAWDDDSWEPQPATLPTYVTAPRASAVPRGIDRQTPGEWTGEAMVQAAQEMRRRSAPTAEASTDHGAQTAEIPVVTTEVPMRRAANE